MKITLGEFAYTRMKPHALYNRRTAAYLLAMPLLPAYLQGALAELGLSCDDFEQENL